MTSNEEPLKTLRNWVTHFLENGTVPYEPQLVQQVILGNEIDAHPDFADMGYVMSKTSMTQLDTGNRDTFVAVKASYDLAKSGVSMPEGDTWLDFIVRRLLER